MAHKYFEDVAEIKAEVRAMRAELAGKNTEIATLRNQTTGEKRSLRAQLVRGGRNLQEFFTVDGAPRVEAFEAHVADMEKSTAAKRKLERAQFGIN